MYSAELLDHFEHPRNSGELLDPAPMCGLRIPPAATFWSSSVKIDAGCIAEIRFRAKGCVPAMACASAITELAKGKSIAEARTHWQRGRDSRRWQSAAGFRARGATGGRRPAGGSQSRKLNAHVPLGGKLRPRIAAHDMSKSATGKFGLALDPKLTTPLCQLGAS